VPPQAEKESAAAIIAATMNPRNFMTGPPRILHQ
jgi:hypothetical protein